MEKIKVGYGCYFLCCFIKDAADNVMPKIIYSSLAMRSFYFYITKSLLAICFLWHTSTLSASDLDTVPCWYNKPSTKQMAGAIGLARDLYVGNGKPLHSRHRALVSLANYLAIKEIPEINEIDLNQNEYLLDGYQVSFSDDYKYQGYIYSHAIHGESLEGSQCGVSYCDIQRCEPTWLCEPGFDGTASLVGTGYQSDTLLGQYRAATTSALKQLEPVFGVMVRVEDIFVSQFSKTRNFSSNVSNSSIVSNSNKEQLRYLVTDTCWQDQQLFMRLNFPDLPALSSIPAQQWMREPLAGGFRGAIGSVQGQVASGLLSDKISMAINRGLLELAKSINTTVTENLLTIEQRGKYYQLSVITQNSELALTARVNAIHFSNTPLGIAVYAWLVEAKI
jgi:hypothetical protein